MGKIITIGELMMRLTPPNHEMLHRAGLFRSDYGGAEANVAVSLSAYGHQAFFLSVLPSNELGDAAIRHLQSNGVNTDWIYRKEARLGVYYYEEGYSARLNKVIYDRKDSSVHQLTTIEIDWKKVFNDVEILHITGITPALSDDMMKFTLNVVKRASEHGVKVSFDFNYRNKLWSTTKAKNAFLSILPYVSICFAGYKDFTLILDEPGPNQFDEQALKGFYTKYSEKYSINYFICTDRQVIEGQKHRLSGYLYHKGKLHKTPYDTFNILERIGGGDAFAAGALHGILTEMNEEDTIRFAVAASILKHTIRGDVNQFTSDEVSQYLTRNDNSDIKR